MPQNGKKLLFTVCFAIAVLLLSLVLKKLVALLSHANVDDVHRRFWTTQAVKVSTAAVLVIGVASIWFDDPTRLTTEAGLLSAGLAFALQRVGTAISGYLVILRGDIFSVGDRIVMGSIQGQSSSEQGGVQLESETPRT